MTTISVAQPDQTYTEGLELVRTTRDACAGSHAVKRAGVRYLPMPSPILSTDTTEEIEAKTQRYVAYKQRANYINMVGRTKSAMVGAIFRRPATVELPAAIQYLIENADGGGQSLEQLAKLCCNDLLEAGRFGILVDYPPSVENATAEQSAGLTAKLVPYRFEDILKWKTKIIAGQTVLTLVVLREGEEKDADEFTVEQDVRYRVLMLTDGIYEMRIYDKSGLIVGEPQFPTEFNGAPWDKIPFVFIGASNNLPSIDQPPLYDMAVLNIAHYNNSAEYEEGLHMFNNPSLFISSDISADQFKAANPNGIQIGSRKGHFIGANGKAELLAMQANGAAMEGMRAKEDQLVAIGARLAQYQSGNETAEAARIRASGESAVLSVLAGNASEGIEKALELACAFMGANPAEVEYSLNREFWPVPLDAQQIAALVGLADSGDISRKDLRDKLRSADLIAPDRSDEDIDRDILSEGRVVDSGLDNGANNGI